MSYKDYSIRAVSAKQKGDIYAFDHEGKMYRGRVELHGDHYLFDDDGKLIRMITGTDTYTIDTSFLAVYQSPFITDANPLVTLPDLQKITVPLPKNIVTKPDRTVWIRICYSGSGVFAKNGWVELKYLKEYYPAEGYELYIAKRSDRVKDRSGGELGHISVGSTVKVVTPKVLIPDPLTPEIRSEDLIQIIYGDGFGWFVEMSLEKIPTEGTGDSRYASIYGNHYEEDGWFPLNTIDAAKRWGNQLAAIGYTSFVYENAIKGHMFEIELNTGSPPTNAEIFIFSGHGTENSQLILYDKEVIDYGDLCNILNERNEAANFSNCCLAIFLACNTADKEVYTEVGGILSAAVECGAKAAFGFVGSVKIDSLMRFMDYMLERLIEGDSIGVAAGYAQDKILLPMLKPNYYIHGDASTCLSLNQKI